MIDVYDYFDYRRLLADVFEAQGRRRTDKTLRAVARKVGFDASFFCKIVKGKRNISPEDALKVADALGLDQEQSAYFDLLVRFNQARSRESQRLCFEKLTGMRQPKAQPLGEDEYYSQWYHPVIRELLNFFSFSGDFPRLAAMLVPPIKPHHARRAVAVLERLGMIARQSDSSYSLSSAFITAGPQVKTAVLHGFQAAMMDLGKEALERFAPDQREIFGLTLSLSREGFQEVKALMGQLKEQLFEIARNDREINGVYQINLQAFPVSRTNHEDEQSAGTADPVQS